MQPHSAVQQYSAARERGAARRPNLFRALAWSLVAGVAWGVLARLFMRFVSTTPQFSWEGTLFLVGLGAVAFVLTGFSSAAMARGWSGWWRLVALPALLLFAGQGLGLLPGALGAFVAVRVRKPWVRVGALVVGLVGNYLLLRWTVDFDWLQPRTLVLGHLLALVAAAWLGVQLALAARPRAGRGPRSRRQRMLEPEPTREVTV